MNFQKYIIFFWSPSGSSQQSQSNVKVFIKTSTTLPPQMRAEQHPAEQKVESFVPCFALLADVASFGLYGVAPSLA